MLLFFCYRCPENIKFKEDVIQLRKGGYKPKVYRLEGPSQVASIMFTHYLENVSSRVYKVARR